MRNEMGVQLGFKNAVLPGALAAAMVMFVVGAAGCDRAKPAADANAAGATATGVAAGSNGSPASAAATNSKAESAADARKDARAAMDEERKELEQVPPPTKSHYLIVQTASAWQNPFIVVGTDKLKVEVMMGDSNPLPGAGGLLRPAAARRNIIEIKTSELGKMLAALPVNAWPYGRVVAVEESAQTARQDRIEMRRNMEATLQTLNSLGVVIHEWSEPAGK
jgi:hypothetical protein